MDFSIIDFFIRFATHLDRRGKRHQADAIDLNLTNFAIAIDDRKKKVYASDSDMFKSMYELIPEDVREDAYEFYRAEIESENRERWSSGLPGRAILCYPRYRFLQHIPEAQSI